MSILGVTGRIGSGKTTLSNYIVQVYGYRNLSFVDKIIAPQLREQGKPVNRKNLQALGSQLYLQYGDIELTEWLLEGIECTERWIIDDIRYPTTAQYIKERFPNQFTLIGLCANITVRYKRVTRRGKERMDSFEDFLEMERALTEQSIDQVMLCADYNINNNGSLPSLHAACESIMSQVLDSSVD